ncbi:MAG: hypothetical protein ACPGQD_05595 [Planctomycetota bacterium]
MQDEQVDPAAELEQASQALAEKIMQRLTGFHGFKPEDPEAVTGEIAEQLADLVKMTNGATTHALCGELWNILSAVAQRFNQLGRGIGLMCDAQNGPIEAFQEMAMQEAARRVAIEPSKVGEDVRPLRRPKSER